MSFRKSKIQHEEVVHVQTIQEEHQHHHVHVNNHIEAQVPAQQEDIVYAQIIQHEQR